MKTPKSVSLLIEELNQNDLEYSLARNWKKIPNIDGDLDLFVSYNQLEIFKEIFSKIKKKVGWDKLIVDYSWYFENKADSILVFYFKQLDNEECLQIDLFFGYSIMGLPFFKSDCLTENRQKFKNFYILKNDLYLELRLFQLYGYLNFSFNKPSKKTLIYLDEIKYNFSLENYSQFRLKMYILFLRLKFVVKNFFVDPFIFFSGIFRRFKYYVRIMKKINSSIFFINKMYQNDTKLLMKKKLKNKYFRNYLLINKFNPLLLIKVFKVVERNGIVVIFINNDKVFDFQDLFRLKKYQNEL